MGRSKEVMSYADEMSLGAKATLESSSSFENAQPSISTD